MTRLLIIHGTDRPTRKGISVSRAFEEVARTTTDFDVQLADLQQIALPFFNEEEHPRSGNYQLEHTKAWAATVAAADVIVWATSEYNAGYPAPLKNAIDYLYNEWTGKPLGIIAWGAGGGGASAAGMLRQVGERMKMRVVGEALLYPSFTSDVDEAGVLHPSEEWRASAVELLAQLREAARSTDE
ncbi:MAG: NAD(P)H-dependent oxidoreductase [Dermabacter sp.]|nr:NAD(P)H-dependent oxidoreductase [Dermabacter sp.]